MSAWRWALHRYRRISRDQKRALIEAAVLVPVVHALQQRLPFERWQSLVSRRVARAPSDPISVQHLAWAVGVASEWLPGDYKCLPRAYAARWLLARHGHACEVQVGVAKDPAGKVEAHAWVVHEGAVVVGFVEDLARFVRFPDIARAFR